MTKSSPRNRKVSGVQAKLSTIGKFLEIFDLANSNEKMNKYKKIFIKRLNSRGILDTCSHFKEVYSYASMYALEYKPEPLKWLRSDSEGFPKEIKFLKEDLRSHDLNKRRGALTLLRSYMILETSPSTDVSSITDPGPELDSWELYSQKWKTFLDKQFSKKLLPLKDSTMFMSSKAGPNGPALYDSTLDALCIEDSQVRRNIEELNFQLDKLISHQSGEPEVQVGGSFAADFDYISDADRVIGSRQERYSTMLQATRDAIQYRMPTFPRKLQHSRIAFISNPGCKTRVVAIADWWTQNALKPIHRWAFRCLRRFKTDGTFSHNNAAESLKRITNSKRASIFCFDLTSATDRFPVLLQEQVLESRFGKALSTAWKELCVERKFYVRELDTYVKYAKGQGMGLHSSWPVFALTHHAIVQFSAYVEGFNTFNRYRIIGDDVAIWNKKVALRYRSILKSLDVPISNDKSIVSVGTPCRGEIAKRLFINGEEISPIPPDAIIEAKKDEKLIPLLWSLCRERGLRLPTEANPVQEFLKNFLFSDKKVKNAWALLTFPGKALLEIEGDLNPWKDFSNERVIEVFNNLRSGRLKDRAKQLYWMLDEHLADPRGYLGELLNDSNSPRNIGQIPYLKAYKAIRGRCGSIYQGMVYKKPSDEELLELEYLVDPTMSPYQRRSRKIVQIMSSLILKTLTNCQSEEKVIVKDSDFGVKSGTKIQPNLLANSSLLPEEVRKMLGL